MTPKPQEIDWKYRFEMQENRYKQVFEEGRASMLQDEIDYLEFMYNTNLILGYVKIDMLTDRIKELKAMLTEKK